MTVRDKVFMEESYVPVETESASEGRCRVVSVDFIGVMSVSESSIRRRLIAKAAPPFATCNHRNVTKPFLAHYHVTKGQ